MTPRELAALGDHLRRCASARGTAFAWSGAAQTLSRLAAPRVVTIIVLFTLASLLASLVI